MRRSFQRLSLGLLLSVGFVSSSFASTKLEVTTFNMRWFGSRLVDPRSPNSSKIDPAKIEARFRVMRDFMNSVVVPRDVVVFQEVVDLKMLRGVLPAGWNCSGYQSHNPQHQHVAICASGNFKLLPVPYDRNTTIEEVALEPNWGRPAVRIDLADRFGKRLVRLVGLHLKSAPEFTKDRVYQMQLVARDLAQASVVPTLITGDMNSFWPKDTGLRYPDVAFMENELKKFDKTFVHVPHKDAFTFRSERFHSQFDQVFVNGSIRVEGSPSVFQVCNQTRDGSGYNSFPYYYEHVSDHCPVKVRVEIQ